MVVRKHLWINWLHNRIFLSVSFPTFQTFFTESEYSLSLIRTFLMELIGKVIDSCMHTAVWL